MMRSLAWVIAALLALHGAAWADGKIYWPSEHVPPRIPYQRAILLHHEGRETLVLQSRFDASGQGATNAAFGWVVPVPSVPDLASTNAWAATEMFHRFERATRPESIAVLPILLFAAFWLSLLAVLAGVLFFIVPALRPHRARYEPVFRAAYRCFLVCLFAAFVLLPSCFSAGGMAAGVEILRAEEVGIYDAKVIKAGGSADLLAWLNANGFRFVPADLPVLDRYVRDGWCFVVARVRKAEGDANRADPTGLIDPLIMTFQSAQPVYPTALTATIGTDTEILIYLLGDRKMACGGRLRLLYADQHRIGRLASGNEAAVLDTELGRWQQPAATLMKFKGTLTPAGMQQDLVFSPAGNNKPYRKYRFMLW